LEDQATEQTLAEGEARPEGVSEVGDALASLPASLREAVVLVYFEGLNHAEAARVLGCAETTVSWRLFRAKRQLKALLSRSR
jgi:RNA polymerase sigma-70 factor (ECF subfamily)